MRRAPALMVALALAGCGGSTVRTATTPLKVKTTPHTIRLASPAFPPGGAIPAQFTCAGRDVSPPLTWSGVPDGTRELALEMIDEDAPGGPFLHWALAGLGPRLRGLDVGSTPPGAVGGRNGFGKVGYGGPCPPPGKQHRYVITVLALRSPSGLRPGFSADALSPSHALALGVLIGTYGRS